MNKLIFGLFKNHQIYLVGGAVRDYLLNKPNNDLDFATSARPEETKAILKSAGYRTHDVGWAYGTVGAVINGCLVQITTFRKNEDYQRYSRQPKVEWGSSIEEDLARRDFTINAMAIGPDNKIKDHYCGQEHLAKHIIHTPIEAKIAFSDDPLRMIRAVRFRSQLNFCYSEEVTVALKSQSHRLLMLPRERILEEFTKILCGQYIKQTLDDLLHTNMLAYFIPELIVLNNLSQDSPYHHKDVWRHTIDVVANSPATIISRTAALFHDIGKPYVKTVKNSVVHFYRHEEISALMTKSILNRMGYPKKWISEIVFLVRNHMRPNLYDGTWSDSAVRRFIKDSGQLTDKLLALSEADITSHKENIVAVKLTQLKELKRRVAELESFKEVKSPVSGTRLMEKYNLQPGKKVGELKEKLIQALLEGQLNINASEEECFAYLEQ